MDTKLSHSWLPLSRKLQQSMHLYLIMSSSTSPVHRKCCASACRFRQLASDEHQADAEYVRQTLLLHGALADASEMLDALIAASTDLFGTSSTLLEIQYTQ